MTGNPIEDTMRDFAVKELNKEASHFLMEICAEKDHIWHYNNQSDEVYCMQCGAINGEYKGLGVMLMEIMEMLKKP